MYEDEDDEDNQPGDEFDPTPWCHWCGAKLEQDCKCGPIAENE